MSTLSTVRNYAELMRVANVFTAVSNVWMGMILSTGHLPGWTAVGVTATSVLLYLAGMVLNDLYDAELDTKERPERPIPSGRIPISHVRILGWSLLFAGVCAGWFVSRVTPTLAPGVISWWLAGLIVAYDIGLKRSTLGPAIMGGCRFMNVLLGLSVGAEQLQWGFLPADQLILPAIGMGIYIWGVSWFARSEATESNRKLLAMSAVGAMMGIVFIAAMPFVQEAAASQLRLHPWGWVALWVLVAGTVLRRMVVAILQPWPKHVQRAVGYAILSVIVIDAAVCLGFAQPYWSLAVLALVAPAMLLSQLFKVT